MKGGTIFDRLGTRFGNVTVNCVCPRFDSAQDHESFSMLLELEKHHNFPSFYCFYFGSIGTWPVLIAPCHPRVPVRGRAHAQHVNTPPSCQTLHREEKPRVRKVGTNPDKLLSEKLNSLRVNQPLVRSRSHIWRLKYNSTWKDKWTLQWPNSIQWMRLKIKWWSNSFLFFPRFSCVPDGTTVSRVSSTIPQGQWKKTDSSCFPLQVNRWGFSSK